MSGVWRSRPRVSLVAYVYNYADYVGEMLESVLAQSFEDFELCFLDDGSTDGTGDVVRRYRDARIRYFRQDNLGRARLDETFNRCAREARGELLAVVNGDDHLHPRKLATQVALFDALPALDVSFHDAAFVDAAGVPRAGSFRPALPEAVLHGGRLGPYFFRHNLIPNPTTMFRRDVWRRVGPQESGWVHDYDFWLRAGVAGCRFHFLPEPLIRYRVHERSHSTSSVRAAKLAEEARAMRRARRARATRSTRSIPRSRRVATARGRGRARTWTSRCSSRPVRIPCPTWRPTSCAPRSSRCPAASSPSTTWASSRPRSGEARARNGWSAWRSARARRSRSRTPRVRAPEPAGWCSRSRTRRSGSCSRFVSLPPRSSTRRHAHATTNAPPSTHSCVSRDGKLLTFCTRLPIP